MGGAFRCDPRDDDDMPATAVAGDTSDGARVVRHRVGRHWKRWTTKLKQGFLDHLSATCDVTASARAIGVKLDSVYYLRRNDPVFASGWNAALRLGYQMVETRLVGFVLSGGASEAGGGDDDRADAVRGEFNYDQALRALAAHRATVQGVKGVGRRGGVMPRRATSEETDALLRKQLDALARRLRSELE